MIKQVVIYILILLFSSITETVFAEQMQKTEFIKQYSKQVERIRSVYTHCQIEAEVLSWNSTLKSNKTQVGYLSYLSNGNKLYSEFSYLTPLLNSQGIRTNILQQCKIINPDLASYICIRKDKDSEYTISSKSHDWKNEINNFWLSTPIATAAFGHLDMTVLDWLAQENLTVTSIVRTTTTNTDQIVLDYELSFSDRKVPVKGSFTFDAEHRWVLTKATHGNGRIVSYIDFEGDIDGVPMLISFQFKQFDSDRKLIFTKDYTVTKFIPEPAPETMFTLASLDIDYKPPPVSRFGFWFYCGIVGIVMIIGGGLLSRWVKAK